MTTSSGPTAPTPGSTPARDAAAGLPEHDRLAAAVFEARTAAYDVPNVIGGRAVRTGRTYSIVVPHQHQRELGQVHAGGAEQVDAAISAATDTWRHWSRQSWDARAQPFRRAADMLEFGPWRDRLVAACMLELSKTSDQADGDAAAETVDFIRANLANAVDLAAVQPPSPYGVTNSVEYRPLEGFVFAVTPFNFVSMNNLALAPALLGNTVVWKPAESASLAAHLTLQLMREAGLPDGVINIVHGDGPEIGSVALVHRDLAAVAFTGSTGAFQHIWRTVGANVGAYRNYPRVVGETGGKGFVLAHQSADLDALATACVRGAHEYQGQKCAAATRLYVPRSLWPALRDRLVDLTRSLVVGDPTEPQTQVGAVINARQFAKHERALGQARDEGLVLVGGNTDDSTGWFVQPTILEVSDPHSPFMTEELFAPILTSYVYDDSDWEKALTLVDESTPYGLTGAVFATDERALAQADDVLRYTAGNYYVNDKPSGAAVGQQPFGGARASGTNDKAGTVWNLIRYVSPRTVKRNHRPPREDGSSLLRGPGSSDELEGA
jgi:1-pyrroline-5-carboxylate dehydrogenase